MEDFDHVASTYDDQFSLSEIGKAQRALVWKYIDKWLDSEYKVLELNCGTGIDAEYMTGKAASVLATDISKQMVQYAQNHHLAPNLSFQQLDLKNVGSLGQQFDFILSNFGGLNCLSEKDWQSFSREIETVLNPGGHFIAVIMSRKCSWERLYYRAKGDKTQRRRRLAKNAVMANVDGKSVATWYYSPHEIQDIVGKKLEYVGVKPVGLFIPPSYMEPYFIRKKLVLNTLKTMERVSLSSQKVADKADHYLIHFRKAKPAD